MDLVQYGQYYNDAMSGMDTLYEDMQTSLKGFHKKTYKEIFDSMMAKYGKVFTCIEEVYNFEEDKEAWVQKLSERFVGYASSAIEGEKRRHKRENMKIDYNMFVVSYVFPLIQGFRGQMSQPLAEAIRDQWNTTFGTQMQCSDYDQIFGGFRTGIFGISFGK